MRTIPERLPAQRRIAAANRVLPESRAYEARRTYPIPVVDVTRDELESLAFDTGLSITMSQTRAFLVFEGVRYVAPLAGAR